MESIENRAGIGAALPHRILIGRLHEIVLKGRNRWRFVNQLKENIRTLLGDFKLGRIYSVGPRLLIELPHDISDELVVERFGAVIGLQNFSITRATALDIVEIEREILAQIAGVKAASFRINTRRADKRFHLNSMAIDRLVGAAVQHATGMKVDLENPELTINIEILDRAAHYSIGKYQGAGGLPVGISGRGLALISGGIDSPVASWRMMRRGLALDFVHFHSYPLLSRASQEKVRELVARLTRFQGRARLMMVPFADCQREIVARVPRPLRVVLYRRFMMRIASRLAAQTGAKVLVTGESLGQVASQTLENMNVITQAATLPLMRPLVAMDKNEIVEWARKLETFEISIIPDQDCCTLFIPKHPETHADLEEVLRAEAVLNLDALVDDTISRTETVKFKFPPAHMTVA